MKGMAFHCFSQAIATMKRDHIDISQHTSNHLDEYLSVKFDYIITVCDHAKEHCPYFPGDALRLHQNFPDPAKAKGSPEVVAQQFDQVRDEIKTYCADFAKRYLD